MNDRRSNVERDTRVGASYATVALSLAFILWGRFSVEKLDTRAIVRRIGLRAEGERKG